MKNRKKHTLQEKTLLLQNKHVIDVKDHQIFYSKEFKLFAVKEHKKGKFPIGIFISSGIPIDLIGGNRRPKELLKSWQKIYKQKGCRAFTTSIQATGNRKYSLEKMNLEDAIHEVAYLREELKYLKKLSALETKK
jgi:hypothetical protein